MQQVADLKQQISQQNDITCAAYRQNVVWSLYTYSHAPMQILVSVGSVVVEIMGIMGVESHT